jgi:hypothetical protein
MIVVTSIKSVKSKILCKLNRMSNKQECRRKFYLPPKLYTKSIQGKKGKPLISAPAG